VVFPASLAFGLLHVVERADLFLLPLLVLLDGCSDDFCSSCCGQPFLVERIKAL
jgi:hypothetical protein